MHKKKCSTSKNVEAQKFVAYVVSWMFINSTGFRQICIFPELVCVFFIQLNAIEWEIRLTLPGINHQCYYFLSSAHMSSIESAAKMIFQWKYTVHVWSRNDDNSILITIPTLLRVRRNGGASRRKKTTNKNVSENVDGIRVWCCYYCYNTTEPVAWRRQEWKISKSFCFSSFSNLNVRRAHYYDGEWKNNSHGWKLMKSQTLEFASEDRQQQ